MKKSFKYERSQTNKLIKRYFLNAWQFLQEDPWEEESTHQRSPCSLEDWPGGTLKLCPATCWFLSCRRSSRSRHTRVSTTEHKDAHTSNQLTLLLLGYLLNWITTCKTYLHKSLMCSNITREETRAAALESAVCPPGSETVSTRLPSGATNASLIVCESAKLKVSDTKMEAYLKCKYIFKVYICTFA